ncbi:MAG: hypothetical protein ACI8XZ_005010 [Gammaproteobacteria bacterium]|jgi:hypothetical protein
MKQRTFASQAFRAKKRKTRREKFLGEMEQVVPWAQVVTVGDVPIEGLAGGDRVVTSGGVCVPIKWIGRQTVSKLFIPAERFRPVRITAGALGDNLPAGDLTLTKDHGLVIDGIIVQAGALVNGSSIIEVPMSELSGTETNWHVDTDGHHVIFA